MRRHHVASWLPHSGLHHLTQRRPSKSAVPFVKPACGTDSISLLKCHDKTLCVSTVIWFCRPIKLVNQCISVYAARTLRSAFLQRRAEFCSSFLTCLHLSVVMSSCSATTLGMGLMGTRSTPDGRKHFLKKKKKLFSQYRSRNSAFPNQPVRLIKKLNLKA